MGGFPTFLVTSAQALVFSTGGYQLHNPFLETDLSVRCVNKGDVTSELLLVLFMSEVTIADGTSAAGAEAFMEKMPAERGKQRNSITTRTSFGALKTSLKICSCFCVFKDDTLQRENCISSGRVIVLESALCLTFCCASLVYWSRTIICSRTPLSFYSGIQK